MSEYSYCVTLRQPPRPTSTLKLWLESWIRPVQGWTRGTARSSSQGLVDARMHWEIRKGKARMTSRDGLVHTCGTPSSCRCNTDRQLQELFDE